MQHLLNYLQIGILRCKNFDFEMIHNFEKYCEITMDDFKTNALSNTSPKGNILIIHSVFDFKRMSLLSLTQFRRKPHDQWPNQLSVLSQAKT